MKYLFAAIALLGLGACTSRRAPMADPASADGGLIPSTAVTQRLGGGASHLPRAVVYSTNGNYNCNVSIPLNATGTAPLSFPGPGDVGVWSEPVTLADGWLLDRRGGIGASTVFLRYTYAQYHALTQVPSVDSLMAAIIPDARVTEAWRLPIAANEADSASCARYIADGFAGCEAIPCQSSFTVTP